MKLCVVSDIHGSQTAAEKAVKMFENEKCDYMLLLGDVLYHGPRNPLPEGHNPQGAAKALNTIKDKIIAVRGNCDADIEDLFDFLNIIPFSKNLLPASQLEAIFGAILSFNVKHNYSNVIKLSSFENLDIISLKEIV